MFHEDASYEFNARYDSVREAYWATAEDARRMAEDDDWAARQEAEAAVAALGFVAEPIEIIPPDDLTGDDEWPF